MNTKSSDTLVKQMMTKIYQQSWRHHKNDVIRDVMVQPLYDQPISKSIEEPLVPNSTLQEDQQHYHNHHQHHHQHLNPNLINNNEESELHNFSTISSSLLLPDSVNSVNDSVNHSQPHTPHDKVCDHTSAKSYHDKTPVLPKPLRNKQKVNDFKPLDLAMDLPDVPPPVPSVPPPTSFTGNGHVVMNIPDTCPTCGAPTDVEKRKQYNFDYGPVRKYARKSPPPPPLPPAQDRSKKIQRLASFNKDRLTGDLRPLTLNRCTSVPSVYECVGIDEPKRYSSPRCPRCVAGAVGRPCRYHKRDHGHHRAQRDTGEKRGLPSQIMDLDDNYIPDCPCCEKAARSSDQKKYHANNSNNNSKNYHHYNMDKHLSFYSGMPHLWNYDLQDYEERRKNYENREKRLIFIVVLFAIILFFTLLYFGIMAFQKFTQIPKSFSTIKSS